MTEYKTVENDPIVRDGEYETRDGTCYKVFGFLEARDQPILGFCYHIDDFREWGADGSFVRGDVHSAFDLMRPWKEKPDADGWIKWEGGECPVDDLTVVQIYEEPNANQPDFEGEQATAENFYWDTECKYRVIRKYTSKEKKAFSVLKQRLLKENKNIRGWIPYVEDNPPDDISWYNFDIVEFIDQDGNYDVAYGHQVPFSYEGTGIFICAYRIVKEPSPEKKKTYKLAEMWKGWYRATDQGFTFVDGSYFHTRGAVKKNPCSVLPSQLLAITPADADSFYEGEGFGD